MRNRKTIVLRLLTGLLGGLLLMSLIFKFALLPDNPTITREYTFDLEDPAAFEAQIPERVTENGQEYVVNRGLTEHEIVSALPFYEKTFEFEGLPTKEAPMKQEVTVGGVKYILDLVEAEYTGGVRLVDVSDTVAYTGYQTAPRVPQTAPISYESSTGEEITIEGRLESFEQVGGYYWNNTLLIKARVEMPVGAVGYIYQGRVKIPYNETTPAWQGYEVDILEGEGLDPKVNQITGARWSSDPVEKDGVITRHAEFTGRRRVSDWQAVYTAKGEYPAYNATALYRGNAIELNMPADDATRTEYTIKAVVHYTLVRVVNANGLYQTAALEPAFMNTVIALLLTAFLTCLVLCIWVQRRGRDGDTGDFFDEDTRQVFQETYADALSTDALETEANAYQSLDSQEDE